MKPTADADSISFTDDNGLLFALHSAASNSSLFLAASDVFTSDGWSATTIGGNSGLNGFPLLGTTANDSLFSEGLSQMAQAGGLSRILWNSTENQSLLNYTTSTYNTGWMNGDIKGAFLSDTDDTDLVGGTDNDRSVNGNDLTVNGTVTRSHVATGADLVAYSGFSASNYLEQPYNSDLDFGTGDFCIMGWGRTNINGTFLSRGDGVSAGSWYWRHLSGSTSPLYIHDGSAFRVALNVALPQGDFVHFALLRRSGVIYLYGNGALMGSLSGTYPALSMSNATAKLRIGDQQHSSYSGAGEKQALLRISATAPTAEQIAKIYEDEKVLFQENAQATLYGSSDAVTALAHDDATNLLHVGTSAGRSVFQGLRRVENTTTAVGTAISASNSLVVEE